MEFYGCIVYADDILLMSASVMQLQNMLDICVLFGDAHNVSFNCMKSFCVKIGPKWSVPSDNLILNGSVIHWVDRFKYLGITFIAGTGLQLDFGIIKQRFYSACNSILVHCKYANDIVKLHLVKSHCLPLLTYCLGSFIIPPTKLKELGVCWNDCFRKIFHYHRWESVAIIQYFCGEMPFDYLYSVYRWRFLTNRKSADNVQFFMKYKYDYAGVRCIEDLARTLNVDISTTSDIKSKVAHALFSSLNV